MARRLFPLALLAGVLWLLLWLFPGLEHKLDAPLQVARGVGATVELHQLQKFLMQRRILDGHFPADREFDKLVRDSLRSRLKDPRLDFWNKPYAYHRTAHGFLLGSAGPDGAFRTSDDLVLEFKE